jgi:putative FmdB family regulatory protein
MPTYEFVCPDGHTFDKFYRKISDSVLELPCPVCGKIATRKVSGGAGLLFKGSGFYITDYGKDGKKGQAPRSGGESAAPKAGESAAAKPAEGAGGEKGSGTSGSTSSTSKSSSSNSSSGE